MSTNDTTLNDLLADGALAALHFSTGAASRNTRSFVSELAAALVSATPKKPLIITSDNGLTAIYRFFQHAELRNAHGRDMAITGARRFADIDGYRGHAYVVAQLADVRHSGAIGLPEAGKWIDGRSPENTHRHDLPVFDSSRVSRAIETLLEQWAASGKLVDIDAAPVVPQRSAVEPTYSDEPDLRSPADLDPADPIWKIPGAIDELRERRRAAGLVDTVRQRVVSAADILRGVR